jgi:hypothetical protein
VDDTLFVIDWGKVRPETMQLLESGYGRVINGVTRDLSQNYQIVQHMPFKQVTLPQSSDLLEIAKNAQSAQQAIGGLIAASSVAIMGTVIISTAYLSHKLDNIQKKIDVLQKELHSQNLVYYSDRITTYFGTVEATREIISNEIVTKENPDLVILKISELSNMRNQLLSFLDNLVTVSDYFTTDHKSIAIDFINMTFDLIPKGVFIETQAAYKIERFYLGDNIRNSAREKYNNSIQSYRDWANSKYRSILKGGNDAGALVFDNKIKEIRELISSEENKFLLEHSA